LLSLPAGTEMFHFPALPHPALCVQAGATTSYGRRVSPFGHPRITVWLPTPRGLSQAPTSFIGSWCQGIHRAPLVTWQTLQIQMLRVHYAVLKIRTALGPCHCIRSCLDLAVPRLPDYTGSLRYSTACSSSRHHRRSVPFPWPRPGAVLATAMRRELDE
jgi:hypothetical protein